MLFLPNRGCVVLDRRATILRLDGQLVGVLPLKVQLPVHTQHAAMLTNREIARFIAGHDGVANISVEAGIGVEGGGLEDVLPDGGVLEDRGGVEAGPEHRRVVVVVHNLKQGDVYGDCAKHETQCRRIFILILVLCNLPGPDPVGTGSAPLSGSIMTTKYGTVY